MAILGIVLFLKNPDVNKNQIYIVFKDLVLIWVAIPAAYLGYCFQRRSAFLSSLRTMWSNMIESVNMAREYTRNPNPCRESFNATRIKLSHSIDEIRGVYRNIAESNDNTGLYPYEALKIIRRDISSLGFTDYNESNFYQSRINIDKCWKTIKMSFLKEFERPIPTYTSTPYTTITKNNLWNESIKLPKKIKAVSGKIFT